MCNLHINAELRRDPTRTTTLRKRFEAEAYKRFRALKGRIRREIVDLDGFGLKANVTANRERFDFPRSDEKVGAFMEWLRQAQRDEILGVQQGTPVNRAARQAWTSIYIESAYQRGVAQSAAEMRAQGASVDQRWVNSAFNRPIHADRVGLAYIRAFEELEGITSAMDQQISRVLAQGIAEGRGPLEIASQINNRVDKVGLTRARTLARTEVISVHAEASLNSYEEAGIEGVDAKAEFATAGDARVCPECAGLEGTERAIDEARGVIPVHPNAVFAGSTFVSYGECEEVVRARYSGPAVVLTLGGGVHGTTIGPNHPMLTARGFVNAAEITEGDYILYDLRDYNSWVLSDVDDKKIPLCEDTFESAVSCSPDAAVSASGSDLHGDRVFCQGEVEAVRPARGLLVKRDIIGIEDVSKNLLMGANPYAVSVSGFRPGDFGGHAVALASTRLVGGSDARVFADNYRFIWVRVTHKEMSHFDGLAFDYSTASSLYCNNGFVVKNCRCSWIPIIPDAREIDLR